MSLETHNKYFRDIAYNRDGTVDWSSYKSKEPDHLSGQEYASFPFEGVLQANYEARVDRLIRSCHHISDLHSLASTERGIAEYCSDKLACAAETTDRSSLTIYILFIYLFL